MARKIKWGIIAPGGIAEKFATGIKASSNGELYAVCSRKIENAKDFTERFGGEKVYDSEEAIANDPDVDIIYISNPHPFHVDSALTCLNAKKPVLCEKPMTVNAADTERLVKAARDNKTFLMEAMWTRFIPIVCKLREVLAAGTIGDIRMAEASFGFALDDLPETSRLLAPELAGGALLDVGIYPLALLSMILGTPTRIQSTAYLGKTGVDEQFMAVLDYEDGVMATATGAVQTQTSHEARIYGTKGSIKLHSPFWCGTKMSIFLTAPADDDKAPLNFGKEEVIEIPYESNGYNCEAEAVAEMILAKETESAIIPLDESLSLAKTMDTAREQWGLKYPFER